jgi:signal transduction histidine kinase
MLARGIHRTVVFFLLLGVLLGGVVGAILHMALAGGAPSTGPICLALGLLWAVWPLAWMATVRVAWPLRELAKVAGELHAGRLASREELPGGPAEVGEVSNALRTMADRVARQLKDQRALMAAVSHELRSPLGRARVLVEMSREGSAPATFHDDLQAEIDAMDGLVGDLLAAARIDFEAVSPRPLDPNDLGRRALALAGLPEDALVADGDPGVVRADPTLLTRALAGLLDNARRYGGKSVRLHVRGRLARVRFEVEDDGPGFAPGDEERAFEPFWRGPTVDGRSAPRGEGLGLALVRQIAQAHRGEAGAENRRDGPGARVWLELPREEDAAPPTG